MEHNDKFASKKLTDSFHSIFSRFEQIIEPICHQLTESAEVSFSNVDFIIKSMEKFKVVFEEREIPEKYEGLTGTLELLDYSLQQLRA